jgi:hypothetical protein
MEPLILSAWALITFVQFYQHGYTNNIELIGNYVLIVCGLLALKIAAKKLNIALRL